MSYELIFDNLRTSLRRDEMDGALLANVKIWTPSNQYLSSGSNFEVFSQLESDNCQVIFQRISDKSVVASTVIALSKGINRIEVPQRVPAAANVIINVEGLRLNITPRRFGATNLTNFRDVGGLPLLDGSNLDRNRYFRSENLSRINQEDIAFFKELGISRIIDLRKDEEKAISPTPTELLNQMTVIESPISSKIAGFEDGLEAILAKKISAITAEDMTEMYLNILDEYSETLIELAQSTIDYQDGATLIHCTAGKDRTGMLVALIQLAHGVEGQYIYHDYLLSNAYRTPYRMESLRPILSQNAIEVENFKPYLSAPLEALDSIFEKLQNLASKVTASE
ncbi:MAG: tyrosine-protein phosphatase [Actinomycetota bacterium]|nr:tyrosine-protein phosphatase [Actinomycetota bacterium]